MYSRDNKVSDSAKSEPKVQSPNNYFKDRIQVSGVPTETTNDCLLNYLENLTGITVQNILTASRDSSERIVIMDSSDEEHDVSKLHRFCQENPMAPNVQLTFSKIPHAAAVLVSGLNLKTTDDTVRFFFANKKRNHGGPLERIERCEDKSQAVIHFKNAQDAESVVKKQSHMLDEHELHVSIWDKCDTSKLFTKIETRRHAEFVDVQTVPLTPVPSGRILNKNHSGESSPEQAFDHSGHYSVSASKFPQSTNDRRQSRNLHTSLETTSIQHGAYPVKIPRSSLSPPSHPSHAQIQHPAKSPTEEFNFPKNPQVGEWPGQCKSNSSLIDDNQFRVKTERKNHPEKPAAQKESIPSQACLDGKQTCYGTANQTKQIEIEIGAAAINRIIIDSEKLRKLTSCIKSYGGIFNWKSPNHIRIRCLIENPPSHWEKEVTDQVHRFVNEITVPGLCNAVSTSRFSQTLESTLVNKQQEVSVDGPLNVGKPADSAVAKMKGTLQRDSMLADENTENRTSISGSGHIQEKTIPKLKTCQLKILMLPHLLEKLQSRFPGLEISVYEDKKEAIIRGPEGLMKKSFPEFLSFITRAREHKLHLNSSLVKMFEKVDTKEWVQEKLIDENGYLCHWEISDDGIILYGHNADLIMLENDFKGAFLNSKLYLEDEELSTLRSPAWKVFEERIQEERKGCPAPLFLPKGNDIIIVDAPSTISETRYKVRKYLAENKSEVKNLDMHPNRSKFLQLYDNDEMKTLSSSADDVGVSVTCNPNGIMAKGLKECLAGVDGTVKELVSRIKEDKMTFKKPGEAKYLTGDKGQAVLNQIGSVIKCFITTDGNGSSSQGIKVLAEVRMEPEQILQIVQGDIIQSKVDAIVNAANGELDHAGGVAAAIVKAGGKSIQKESNELIEKYGPLSERNLMVTKAGALPCSHILHAVGPTWKGGNGAFSTVYMMATEVDNSELDMCAVCLEGYRDPKFLPCYHTFCAQCIKDVADRHPESSFPCPSCRKPTSLPPGGVSALQCNFYIRSLRNKQLCQVHRNKELELYCDQCDKVICLLCKLTQHEQHNTQDLHTAAEQKKTQLSADMNRLQQAVTAMTGRVEVSRRQQKEMLDKMTSLEENIRNRHATIVAAADKFRDEALDSLRSVSTDIESQIKMILKQQEDNLQELINIHQNVEQTLNSGTESDIITVASEMRSGRGIQQSVSSVTLHEITSVCPPVLRYNVTAETMLQKVRDFVGTVSNMKMALTAPEMTVMERFRCGQKTDIEVYSLFHQDSDPPVVYVCYEQCGLRNDFPVKVFNEKGDVLSTESNSGIVSNRRYAKGQRMSYTQVAGVFYTFCKSLNCAHYVLNNYMYLGKAVIVKVNLKSSDPLKTEQETQFRISVTAHRSFDVDDTEQHFVVLEEAQLPDARRKVRLYQRPEEQAVCTYIPHTADFQPSDLCFYRLADKQVLLITDELNDVIHVVQVQNREMRFLYFLAQGCPLLIQPKAISVDVSGRLWLACRGGNIITMEPKSFYCYYYFPLAGNFKPKPFYGFASN